MLVCVIKFRIFADGSDHDDDCKNFQFYGLTTIRATTLHVYLFTNSLYCMGTAGHVSFLFTYIAKDISRLLCSRLAPKCVFQLVVWWQ